MNTPNQNKLVIELSSGPALIIDKPAPEDQNVHVAAFPNEVTVSISINDNIFALSALNPAQAKELVNLLQVAIKEAIDEGMSEQTLITGDTLIDIGFKHYYEDEYHLDFDFTVGKIVVLIDQQVAYIYSGLGDAESYGFEVKNLKHMSQIQNIINALNLTDKA